MLSEVGATEELGHKVAWVTDFFAGLARTPDVVGFNWFDYAITADGRTTDWRIDSTNASFTAFKSRPARRRRTASRWASGSR